MPYTKTVYVDNSSPPLDASHLNNAEDQIEVLTDKVESYKLDYVEGGGSTNAYTATLSPALAAYSDGVTLKVKMGSANTSTTPTLNVNSLGAKTIYRPDGSALFSGDLQANKIYEFTYNSTLNGFTVDAGRNLVLSSVSNTAGFWDTGSTAPTGTARLNYSGYLYATRVYGAYYNDYAEYFEKGDNNCNPGDIVMIDSNCDDEKYIKCCEEFSNLVVGVVSNEYSQCIGGNGDGKDNDNFYAVGMSGRLYVNVVGKVSKGDFIVSSKIPGIGMATKEYIPGTVVGKSLVEKITNDIGKIRIIIMNI